jgi:molecular chaperone Hsp33
LIKRLPEGESLRRRLEENAKDRLYHFLLDYGAVRGALLHASRLVGEMRANHELGPLETLVLGHAYIGATLLSVNLKGADRLKLQVQCSGPAGGFSAEANAFGEVRGYLAAVPIPAEAPVDPGELSPLFGEGVLTVTRYLSGARQPFSGQVALQGRGLAENLTHYFLASEQAGSVFQLSVRLDSRGQVQGAGGLFLQVLPGAEPPSLDRLEGLARGLPSVGAAFAEGLPAEQLLAGWFAPMNPLLLGSRRVAFMCHCSAQRFGRFLGALPREELADMLEKGPFPVVTTCSNCNSRYSFSRGEIERLYREHP